MSLEDELLEVAKRGKLDVVTELLDRGVNVEARNKVRLSDYKLLAEKHKIM